MAELHDAPVLTPAPAPIPAPVGAPLPEDGLIADRMRFWSWFTGTTTRAAIGLAVLLILLAYFLV